MKKSLMYAFLALLLLSIGITNEYLNIKYHTNIGEYFEKSSQLTDEELKWLNTHGPIVFGSDQSSPPLRYIDTRDGQYKGLIIDYIQALSIEMRHEVAFEPVDVWSDAFSSLKSTEKDFFDMIPSDKRRQQFEFTDPIYTLQGVILKAKASNINIYNDLANLKVAIPAGDYAIEYLRIRLPELDIVESRNMKEAMLLLQKGLVDCVVGDEPVIVYLLDDLEMKEDYDTSKPLYTEATSLAVKKTDEALVGILNKAIFNLKKKDVMTDLQQKWFGISENFSNKSDSDSVSLLFFGFISIAGIMTYIAYSWNHTLKKEVDKRTQELYISRQKLKVTLDGLTNPIVVINNKRVIVNNNKIFCEFAKCSSKKPLGQSVLESHRIFELELVTSLIDKTFATMTKQRDEVNYKESIYIVSAFPVTDRSEEQTILVMFEDVSRFKIAEQRLLQDSKMKSVGILAAGVAHEIRNPLGLIGHYSYILKTNKMSDKERQDKAITVIENSVERASNIIDNLLNFSRITSDDIRKRNIKEFITNIVSLENKAMESKGVKLTLDCDETIVCGIRPEPLKHILINLISNAIDAITEEGQIDISCLLENHMLKIIVSDNGKGMEAEVLNDIFMPFFTTKQTSKGTGLGLYIVYNEVTKYGGSVEVTSTVGEGTSFTLNLPNQEGVK